MQTSMIDHASALLEKADTVKYSFTGQHRTVNGTKVYQIMRNHDSLIGGWIEHKSNLAQSGSCFVYDDATVTSRAKVSDSARVYGNAAVSGSALVWGRSQVGGSAVITDDAEVFGSAEVIGSAVIEDSATVSDQAVVKDQAHVFGKATVTGHAQLSGSSQVSGTVTDDAVISGQAQVVQGGTVSGAAQVSGTAIVRGQARLTGSAEMSEGEISDEAHDGTKLVIDTAAVEENFRKLSRAAHLPASSATAALRAMNRLKLDKSLSVADRSALADTLALFSSLLTAPNVLAAMKREI